ncbi:DUF3768 domain-containing protein [Bradyrhizobium sp. USDA 3315]
MRIRCPGNDEDCRRSPPPAETHLASNDPHDEHDFGSFELAGETFFWKIDCYDAACETGSEGPADPQKTTRLVTVMLAYEY